MHADPAAAAGERSGAGTPSSGRSSPVLARIPDGATVSATNGLAPHLTSRCRVLLFPSQPDEVVRPEWIVAELPPASWPADPAVQLDRLTELSATTYTTVVRTGGILLLHRI
ncbi:DUF2079 domain-containing protein [Saccharothrix sp. AJ9571]|nr:DUF2079 domain-containing protein [Saccharothrix sp. AJ9571]